MHVTLKTMIEDDRGESLLALDELLQFTGLNRSLLHAWERRYGLLPAGRNASGRRFYTLEQAERLRRLRLAVDAGHRIGTIAGLSVEELAGLVPEGAPSQALRDFIDSARLLDSGRMAGLLRIRLRQQGTGPFILETVVPLLRHVGDLWSSGKLAVASEHIISVALKHVLLSCLLEQERLEDRPVAVVTTPEGEQHEFGALAAALLARIEGFDAIYLGPTLPVREIAAAASRLKADVVLISTLMMTSETLGQLLHTLRQQLPEGIILIAGGRHLGGIAAAEGLVLEPRLEHLPGLLRGLLQRNTDSPAA